VAARALASQRATCAVIRSCAAVLSRCARDAIIWICGYPTWSPNGRRLAFKWFRPKKRTVGIYVANADGSHVRRLVAKAGSPAWSPDGRLIAYTRLEQYTRGISVVDVDKRCAATDWQLEISRTSTRAFLRGGRRGRRTASVCCSRAIVLAARISGSSTSVALICAISPPAFPRGGRNVVSRCHADRLRLQSIGAIPRRRRPLHHERRRQQRPPANLWAWRQLWAGMVAGQPLDRLQLSA
jgi:WD40 repeat protein